MSSEIGPDSWLECVVYDRSPQGDEIIVGALYRVRELRGLGPLEPIGRWFCTVCQSTDVRYGLSLVGIPDRINWAWCPCCFKPIDDGPGISVAQEREVEDA